MAILPGRRLLGKQRDLRNILICESNQKVNPGLHIQNGGKTIEKKIESKLRLLDFHAEGSSQIIGSNDLKAIERYASVFESNIDKIHELKVKTQETKIEDGENTSNVRLWTHNVELSRLDWIGFWSQYETEIDKSTIPFLF